MGFAANYVQFLCTMMGIGYELCAFVAMLTSCAHPTWCQSERTLVGSACFFDPAENVLTTFGTNLSGNVACVSRGKAFPCTQAHSHWHVSMLLSNKTRTTHSMLAPHHLWKYWNILLLSINIYVLKQRKLRWRIWKTFGKSLLVKLFGFKSLKVLDCHICIYLANLCT